MVYSTEKLKRNVDKSPPFFQTILSSKYIGQMSDIILSRKCIRQMSVCPDVDKV